MRVFTPHPPPPQCFPLISIYNFHISKISLLSFSIFIYHFPSSCSFFRFLFSNILSFGLPTLFLPISFQLSSLCVGYHIFPIFVTIYFTRIFFLPDDTFPVFLSSWLFLCILPIRCLLFHSPHVHERSNFKFSPCLFFLRFSFFSFHFFFPLSPNFRAVSQYSAFPSKCSLFRILLWFQSLFPILYVTSRICYSFPGGVFFLLSPFLVSGSARWCPLIVGTWLVVRLSLLCFFRLPRISTITNLASLLSLLFISQNSNL